MNRDHDQMHRLASLADPARRSVYAFVVEHATGADRNQVAAALDLSRSLAAYHLERLVEDGLLTARFEHRGTRRGPGSGRPSKIYERADTEFEVSLPPRDYGLAARVMADALDALADQGTNAITAAAQRQGSELRASGSLAKGGPADLDAVARELAGFGYEPYPRDDCLRMRNCPFDAIARDHRELVCSMNVALVRSLLDAGPKGAFDVALEPEDNECCVAIRASASRS
jgi:predicted ArsR family transcriptional regulator